MKLAFIGASVTAQGFDHQSKELVGYREVLSQKLIEYLNFNEIKDFSYPGNRLSDAGLIKLMDVINFKPNVCIVEPLIEDSSRGEHPLNEEIYFFYEELLKNNIFPITVFLPDPTKGHCRDWPNYKNYKRIIIEKQLLLIEDIPIPNTENRNEYFNGVHTTAKGAQLYANEIYKSLVKIFESGLPKVTERDIKQRKVYITKLTGTNLNELLKSKLLLWPVGDNDNTHVRIIQKSKIGSYSPLLDYTLSSNQNETISLGNVSVWDPYCHYERHGFAMLFPRTNIGKDPIYLKLSLSKNPPNYKLCRREFIQWPKINELNLSPIDDAYIISNSMLMASLVLTDMDLSKIYPNDARLTRIPARSDNSCFIKGWSYGELWGRWTDGEEVVTRLYLGNYRLGKTQVIFDIKYQAVGDHHFSVLVNGNRTEYNFNQGLLCFPVEIKEDKTLEIVFKFENIKSPFEQKRNAETRKLGIGVVWFQVLNPRRH